MGWFFKSEFELLRANNQLAREVHIDRLERSFDLDIAAGARKLELSICGVIKQNSMSRGGQGALFFCVAATQFGYAFEQTLETVARAEKAFFKECLAKTVTSQIQQEFVMLVGMGLPSSLRDLRSSSDICAAEAQTRALTLSNLEHGLIREFLNVRCEAYNTTLQSIIATLSPDWVRTHEDLLVPWTWDQ